MKSWLKENWFKIGFLAIFVIFIVGAFYWFEWRPSQIKKECNRWALEEIARYMNKDSQTGFFIVSDKEIYNNFYSRCSRENGL